MDQQVNVYTCILKKPWHMHRGLRPKDSHFVIIQTKTERTQPKPPSTSTLSQDPGGDC